MTGIWLKRPLCCCAAAPAGWRVVPGEFEPSHQPPVAVAQAQNTRGTRRARLNMLPHNGFAARIYARQVGDERISSNQSPFVGTSCAK